MILWKRMFARSLNFSLAKGNLKLQSGLSLSYLYELSERLPPLDNLKNKARLCRSSLSFPRGCVCVCSDVRYLTWLFVFPEEERHDCGLIVRMVTNMSSDSVGRC